MDRTTFREIAAEVLGAYTSPTKLDELFDRLRDAGRGAATIEWRRNSPTTDVYLGAMSGDLEIGYVRKDVFAMSKEPYWPWGMCVDAHRTDFEKHGQADDMETAKAEVLKNWEMWLDLAALRHR